VLNPLRDATTWPQAAYRWGVILRLAKSGCPVRATPTNPSRKSICVRFRRRFSENADVQIDQPFSKGTRILVGLWRKAQADARSGFGDRGHQWSGTKFDESFVGANCEGQLQSADIQVIRGRPQNGLRVAGQRMNAIA
jgi:hypothetical protein